MGAAALEDEVDKRILVEPEPVGLGHRRLYVALGEPLAPIPEETVAGPGGDERKDDAEVGRVCWFIT